MAYDEKKKNKILSRFHFFNLILFSIYQLRFTTNQDYFWLLIITIICVATDLGGYIFGKIFKGPKLTKLSPNKTYSGMIGGYFLSLIFTSFSLNYFSKELTINWLFFVLLISSMSQLGDIIISYFKRLSKIKDTGKIIPGHGGLLDRVDGMIFAFPFSYVIILTGFFN